MDKRNKKDIFILVGLLILGLIINYNFLDSALEDFVYDSVGENVFVERVIDGDTIVSNGTSIRLLGINTPERGEKYYGEAKTFLENLVLNKSVVLEFVGPRKDKYFRTLAYVFLEGENTNVKMVESGFANYYFYDGRDKYSDDLEDAWNSCRDQEVNLCSRSEDVCGECVGINGKAIKNNCDRVCSIEAWTIKGEGRTKFEFNGTLEVGESKMWGVELGRSLFLRDEEGGLVEFRR